MYIVGIDIGKNHHEASIVSPEGKQIGGCLNDGGIDQGALSHHDACFGQPAIDGLEQLAGYQV